MDGDTPRVVNMPRIEQEARVARRVRTAGSSAEDVSACPHVNRNDLRCASRFSIGRLDQAFDVCFGCYDRCPMFHLINAELNPPAHKREPALITITSHGRRLPLRATGS